MSTNFLSKSKLAGVLLSTKRTLTNYVNTGMLPPPERFGRDSGWRIEVLRTILNSEQSLLHHLSEEKRNRLAQTLSQLDKSSAPNCEEISDSEYSKQTNGHKSMLPEPIFADASFNLERDLRPFRIAEVKRCRGQVDIMAQEARHAAKGSDHRLEVWTAIHKLNSHIDDLEVMLSNDFIHLHGPSQFLGNRELLTSPVFNIRNPRSPRINEVEILLGGNREDTIRYHGPELRQDDGQVFMSLLNITRDVRIGKSVGFSPQRLCESLWGYYDGVSRARLKAIISRLQIALLHFPTFRVQLVQRFDFPQRGFWSVSLDIDIVRLFTKRSVVWLDQSQTSNLKNGLATWLYGYIRSQTTLIPTKVERLRVQCGSEGALHGFREGLKSALGVLSGELVIDIGWYIDRHDMLHWRKLRD
ncbi:Plasmid replication initiator protein TrfA [Comamonadaceae bacterium]